MSDLWLSDLTKARQELVRLCQNIGQGQIVGLFVQDGDPVLTPPPTLLIDFKLDMADNVRP